MNSYWTLVRPRIAALVLLAMAVAAWTAGEPPAWSALASAMAGTALVISGAVALNQRIELEADAKMARTAGRPLPTGRLTARQAVRFGLAISAVGMAWLAVATDALLVGLAVASWLIYVGLYTPLKSRSPWQTLVGAVSGAMPVLLGAAVAGAALRPAALALFGVVLLWQFPHAMALAWIYRRQFAAAGVRLVSVVEPSGRIAGLVAAAAALALLPASLAMPSPPAGIVYRAAAAVLGLIYLAASAWFCLRRDDASARWLLRASLVYLPVLLVVLLV